jgi:UDP-4-amino-4,6-dideoxy-N-acetyl-beta-L-altrosamine transaminase
VADEKQTDEDNRGNRMSKQESTSGRVTEPQKSLPYGRQWIDDQDIAEVVEVLKSDFLTTGPKVKEFEEKFSQYVGSKYGVAVANGTAALHVACLAAGLTQRQEFITSPLTFVASANCGLYCGATPVFVDVDNNGLIDAEKIEKKITRKTRVLIPVHYSGLPCDMELLQKIAQKHKLTIIEDACHAIGARYKDTRIGDCTFSDQTVFSFHPVKQLTTGEGGMITTNSKETYEKLLLFRNHGMTKDPQKYVNPNHGPWYHEMQHLGFNYRITDFQCALGLSQLKKIDSFIEKRRQIAKQYDEAFQDYDNLEILTEKPEVRNSYHLYPVRVKDAATRLRLFNFLRMKGILCQVHYIPVYLHPYYQALGYREGLCPCAEDFYQRELSLPIYPLMSTEDVTYVIEQIFLGLNEAV